MIAGEHGKAVASGNRLSLRYPSIPARKHDGYDSKFNSIHARRRQALHPNDSFLQQEGGGRVKKMIHHFRHLPQERKSTEGAFPLFRKNGKGEQFPASRFARGLAGLPAHRQTDQTAATRRLSFSP